MVQGGGFDDQQVTASDERLEQILVEATGYLFCSISSSLRKLTSGEKVRSRSRM